MPQEKNQSLEDVEVAQNLRLYGDILIMGPYLMYIGAKGKLNMFDKIMLITLAGSTFFYNLNNYIEARSL